MKKRLFGVLFLTLAVSAFAGGVAEYQGKKYLTGLAAYYALVYENGGDLGDIDLSPFITDGKLYFACNAQALEKEAILKRGFVQAGDKFFVWGYNDGLTGVYSGSKINATTQGVALVESDRVFVIGYSTHGKGIVITDVILTQERYDALEKQFKPVQSEQ